MRVRSAIASIAGRNEGRFFVADIKKLPGAINVANRRSYLPSASILEGMLKQLGNGKHGNTILHNLFNGNIIDGPHESIRVERVDNFTFKL